MSTYWSHGQAHCLLAVMIVVGSRLRVYNSSLLSLYSFINYNLLVWWILSLQIRVPLVVCSTIPSYCRLESKWCSFTKKITSPLWALETPWGASGCWEDRRLCASGTRTCFMYSVDVSPDVYESGSYSEATTLPIVLLKPWGNHVLASGRPTVPSARSRSHTPPRLRREMASFRDDERERDRVRRTAANRIASAGCAQGGQAQAVQPGD